MNERSPEWFRPVLIDNILGIIPLPITSFHESPASLLAVSTSRKVQSPCYTAPWIIRDLQQPYIQNYTGRCLVSC